MLICVLRSRDSFWVTCLVSQFCPQSVCNKPMTSTITNKIASRTRLNILTNFLREEFLISVKVANQ
jgi:hypothetical protein